MKIGVVTLFPEMFQAVTASGITGRAVDQGTVTVSFWNPRDYTSDKHRTVDDKPYGGGPGMLMKVGPLKLAIEAARAEIEAQCGAAFGTDKEFDRECQVIYLSPQGEPLTQQVLEQLARAPGMVLVAGRYEGVDERLLETVIDVEYSIGDYVLSGGELPAMVLIDGVTRLQPGAVGDEDSVKQDSFSAGLLDHPHYTRPETVEGLTVPSVLLGGNHAEIARWRRQQALGRTFEKRPDLLKGRELSDEDRNLLDEYLKANPNNGAGRTETEEKN